MKKPNLKNNRSTLIAAALVVTAATGFGTYAATNDEITKITGQKQSSFTQQLTADQKAGLEQARALYQSGDKTGAKAILDTLDLDNLEWGAHFGPKMGDLMKDLTTEQKDGLNQAKELFEAGKADEAKALLEKLGVELPQKFEMKLNLTDTQKEALKQAKDLRAAGKEDEAKQVLEAAGIPRPLFGQGPGPMMSEAAMTALEAGDFEAWKAAVTAENPDAKILSDIDETKFKVMVEIDKAIKAGDMDTAKKLAADADLPVPFMHKDMHFMMDNLTEAQKTRLDEAHKLMESGDKEGAKAIFTELNLPFPEKFMMKQELTDAQKTELKEAKELMAAGKTNEAKAIFDKLGLGMPVKGKVFHHMENLTEEQQAGLKKAEELRAAGDKAGAKVLMNSLDISKPKDGFMRWVREESEDNSEETEAVAAETK